jgi:hypothetical protein
MPTIEWYSSELATSCLEGWAYGFMVPCLDPTHFARYGQSS